MKGFASSIDSPCHGCEKRTVGCHGSCELYSSFKGAVATEREEEKKRRRTDYMMTSLNVARVTNTKKRARFKSYCNALNEAKRSGYENTHEREKREND